MDLKRFYVFTGKGGVGKSTLAFAFANLLKTSNKKVKFFLFEDNGLVDLFDKFEIDYHILDLYDSAKVYVSNKLKSQVIGNFIVNTRFFKALIDMIPGFSYLVYLGHISQQLINDNELIAILDSPSSGHAKTMFESIQNFKNIFKTGLLVEDIDELKSFLYDKKNLCIKICTALNPMSIQEAIELSNDLNKLDLQNTEIVGNNAISKSFESETSLPHFLKTKIDNESIIIEQYKDQIKKIIEHTSELDEESKIKYLTTKMDILL